MGVVRFALIGHNPWRGQISGQSGRSDSVAMVEANLPCPELSRLQYAKLCHYDPDDSERDGLGHAPVLRPGQRYRLTFVRTADVVSLEPSHQDDGQPLHALVAVNPL